MHIKTNIPIGHNPTLTNTMTGLHDILKPIKTVLEAIKHARLTHAGVHLRRAGRVVDEVVPVAVKHVPPVGAVLKGVEFFDAEERGAVRAAGLGVADCGEGGGGEEGEEQCRKMHFGCDSGVSGWMVNCVCIGVGGGAGYFCG